MAASTVPITPHTARGASASSGVTVSEYLYRTMQVLGTLAAALIVVANALVVTNVIEANSYDVRVPGARARRGRVAGR